MSGISLHGLLNTGLLGVYTHKIAMNVVGHNMSNVNTEGYSRQRAVIVTTPPLGIPTLAQPSIPLQMGTGSKVADIKRVRDAFLDVQYRNTNNRKNYWDNIYGNMHYIEQLFGEPGENGIRVLFDNFWSAMEELKSDPNNEAAKGQIVARADELGNTMKDLDYRLDQLQEDINNEIATRVNEMNNYLKRVADLNNKIRSVEISGSTPNDLLDERDRVIDQLSNLTNIKVTQMPSGEISLGLGDRTILHGGVYEELYAEMIPGKGETYGIFSNNSQVEFADGKMKALFELRDEIIPKYRGKLDEFAVNLVDTVNLIHKEGWDKTGTITGSSFFKSIEAVKSGEDARFFRVAGFKDLFTNPIKYFYSKNTFTSDPSTNIKDNDLYLIYSNKDTIKNSTAGDLSSIELSGKYENGKFYIESDGDVNKTIYDVDGSYLSKMGLNTSSVQAIKINKEGLKSGDISFEVGGTNISINSIDGTDLNTFANSINNSSGNDYIRAIVKGDNVYIVATDKVAEKSMQNLVIKDDKGVLSNGEKVSVDVLDTSNPTLNNFIKDKNGDPVNGTESIEINGIKIEFDTRTDSLKDLAEKINKSNTGVTAFITPHGKFVLRAGASLNFDLKNSKISGKDNIFQSLGLIDKTPITENEMTLVSTDSKWEDINNMFNKADILRLDNEIGLVNRMEVTDGLKDNPSNLSVDLGILTNSNKYVPVGPKNVSVWDVLSGIKDLAVLNDGKDGFSGFLANTIAEMGIEGETAEKMKGNAEALHSQIDGERDRVQGVSIDEEVSNMIKYQKAFNASARFITAIDQMMEKIVNSLGTVGR
ncbi:MAG: flagellar hook-associated protein 1 [Oceanotoga sp.]|jgi:flagellar hook-associated protein 1 FlgK|uniref:flagellar hook-associated protein FlgK n=1 Tax=Oceanotoga sp. TaxID=2108366 RepID=UPI00264F1DE6|nr:flagellar hook-associated protein FlgK [Oceanotoga sp.]MDN5342344.1 flagellar hook-associated protein 1 [Oceanotoga sp.]